MSAVQSRKRRMIFYSITALIGICAIVYLFCYSVPWLAILVTAVVGCTWCVICYNEIQIRKNEIRIQNSPFKYPEKGDPRV